MSTFPDPQYLYSCQQLRSIEQAALARLAHGTLMERAGAAAVDFILSLLGSVADVPVLVLAGPGNNGGDALVVARLLADRQARVDVVLLGSDDRRPEDAARALVACRAHPVRWISPGSPLDAGYRLAVDGLYGIGLRRGFDAGTRGLIEAANALPCPIVALDVPSGLDADSGTLRDTAAIRASYTVTYIGNKPGLHTGHGRDHAGTIRVAGLDIDPALYQPSSMRLNGVDVFGASLTPRRHSAHKGSHGDLAIAGGAAGMSGAVLLAARAGAHCGAGRTFAALLAPSFPYDPPYPELMLRSADDFDFATAVVVAGPGMGRSAAARALLAKILQHSRPILLDADALNLVAADPALQVMVAQRRAGTVLTPHPLEAARLLQTDTAGVQADRIASARALAQRFACVAVLKGSGSVIANQHGEVLVNPSGNPALATAGSGDVLAGICGALLAQGYSAWHAAAAAVWLHGAAADALVAGGIGPIGLMAGELIPRVRSLLNELVAQRRRNAND